MACSCRRRPLSTTTPPSFWTTRQPQLRTHLRFLRVASFSQHQGKRKKAGPASGHGKKAGSSASIADQRIDFSQWYMDVLREAEVVDHGPVRLY